MMKKIWCFLLFYALCFAQFYQKTMVLEMKEVAKERKFYALVAPDDSRISTITTRLDGFVEELELKDSYNLVHKGQPLYRLYSPELLAVQNEYINALKFNNNAKNLAEKLRLLGVEKDILQAITKNKKAQNVLPFFSQSEGFVMEKNITQGQFIKKGETLYKLIDLSKVWVIVQVPQSAREFLQEFVQDSAQKNPSNLKNPTAISPAKNAQKNPSLIAAPDKRAKSESTKGDKAMPTTTLDPSAEVKNSTHNNAGDRLEKFSTARFSSQGMPQSFVLQFLQILPNVDPDSKFLQVRFLANNKDLKLFPNLFGIAHLSLPPRKMLIAPSDAVISRNNQLYVFVKDGEQFTPTKITARRLENGDYEILSGVDAGVEIAKDSLFMLDADAQNNGDYE
ncbi:efflux RND transporter periplasmic adaptor subunit [Helicobacter mustelae]|uniref:efflux RND transporter periplasmic adaptor subunit n=1 Tax=Helicobacter mustelae TaxID=217 RepID=UPI000E0E7B62|nr:efflux RND transporter periplasmic adaptor subunit [Helicobacter mustelae]